MAKVNLTEEEITRRLEEQKVSYVQNISELFDAYITRDWEKASKLLAVCASMIDPEIQVYVVEKVIDAGYFETIEESFDKNQKAIDEIVDNGE